MSRTTKDKLFKFSVLSTIWQGLHGPGKSVTETPEQIVVRKWLQGEP